MYKARVEAVSGTKILAGGKWLQCIGNKSFRVGELAWTDGRCAYGNHYTPQQPLVITAPQDEGIPIFTTGGYYIFRKSKLIKIADYDRQPYNPRYESAFYSQNYGPGEPFGMIVNNKNKIHMIINRDDGIHDSTIRYKKCVAANIDKSGDLWTLNDISGNLQIKLNGDVLSTINYNYLTNDAQEACPSPRSPFRNDVDTYAIQGFIENGDRWAAVVFIFWEKCSLGEAYEFEQYAVTKYGVARLYYISNDQTTLLDTEMWRDYMPEHSNHFIDTFDFQSFDSPGRKDFKFPLQDGYYYEAPEIDAIIAFSGGSNYSTVYNRSTYTERRKIFSPNGEKIFEGAFNTNGRISFHKTKYGYLLGVTAGIYNPPLPESDVWRERAYYTETGILNDVYYPYYSHDQLWVGGGLYLLKDGKIEQLLNERVLNHRLCPMTRYKNWQKRIRDLPTE